MAIQIGTAGSRITANAAAVAVAMGSGTTTAEAQALGAMLSMASERPGEIFSLLRLANNKELTEKR
jgi:hypothetical protein